MAKKTVRSKGGRNAKEATVMKDSPKQAKTMKKPVGRTSPNVNRVSYNKKKIEMSSSSSEETSGDEEESEQEIIDQKRKNSGGKTKKKDESSEDEEETSSSDDNKDDEEEESSGDNVKDDKGDDESSSDEDDDDDDEGKGKGEAFFTDENADWLKPKKKKQQLLSDSDDDDEDDEFSDGKSDDEEELLEVERQSRIVDAEIEAERREAESELRRTIAQNTSVFHLPTPEELEQDADRVVPPSEIRARIDSILEVLADFKNRKEPERSRSEYVDQLSSDIAEMYGYLPELVDYFLSMLGPSETLEFIDASDKPRPLVIRTNTLKARRKDLASALMKRGVNLEPLAKWSKVGLKITESPVPVGATPEYLSGMYMLQSAASMCPVMALSPQPNERVLDMAAAPGGKTSYIAQLMRNTGVIIANDRSADRQKATVANMHRLGVRNVVACTHDGRKLGNVFHRGFDRILLDAPCSGLGVISRDPSVKVQRTMNDVLRCGHLQKELLLSAIDALNHKSKTGGVMVYSTCSVSVAENEEVVNYALCKRDIKIVDTGLDGVKGFTRYQQKRFHPSIALTRRFYPHVHNMDGFYVAKIQKLSDRIPGKEEEKEKAVDSKEHAEDEDSPLEKEAPQNTKDSSSNKIDKTKKKAKKRSAMQPQDVRPLKKGKRGGISVPPKEKQEKSSRSAKTTKPRRMMRS